MKHELIQSAMVILLLSFCLNMKAWQTEGMEIEYITRFNGLSDNNINQIFKDRSGFIWFATNDGLNRYDGHKVKPFVIPDITLSIYDIHQTETDWLWINTNKGLMAFHLPTKTYKEFSTLGHPALKKFQSAIITGMEGQTSSAILVSTSVGLFKISIETKAGEQLKLNVYDWTQRNKVTGNFLTAITQDENGFFYLGSPNHFVVQLDTTTNHVTKYDSPVKDRTGNILFNINHLQYNQGILWIATMSAGLVKLNTKTGKLEAFPSATIERNNPLAMVHHDIYATGTDGDGSLWVGTWNGINRLKKSSNTPECYNLSHPLFTQMQETRIQSVLCADDQVIWIGTFGGGAIKIDLNKSFYRRVPLDSEYEVKGIAQDELGRIWLATFHGGIRHSTSAPDPSKPLTFTAFKTLTRPDNQETISNFLCAFTDDHKTLWFGSENSSLIRINSATKESNITVIKPMNGPHFNGRVETIEAANDNELLLGTSEGLIVTNRANGQSRYIYFSNASLNKLHIRSFCHLSKDSLAIGSYHGTFIIPINQLTERTPIIGVGQEQTSNTEKLHDTWALAKDHRNNLWLGFRGGLGKISLPDSPLKTFTTREGLCDNFITAMGFDHQNTLWIATNSGITKFDPRTFTSENHYIANNNRCLFIDRDNNIIIGNNNGILLFNPDNRPKSIAQIHPLIANIQINNTPINNFHRYGQYQTLKLHYPDNNITFELTSSSHKQVHLQHFTYQLSVIDQYPITVDAKGSSIAYKGLSPGKYVFTFNVTAADGTTGESPMQLEIIVLPPWWQTTWAIVLFTLLIIGLTVAFWRFRYRQVLNKQKEILYRNQMEHQLELERMDKKNQEELLEAKSKFFINITHELLTPLTLITTPLSDILARKRDIDGALYKRLQSIGDNAIRLSHLIKQVLDFRKLETGNLTPHLEPMDLSMTLQHYHQQFMPLAKAKNMAFSLSLPVGNLGILADQQMVETIVTNLLSNAFKYTHESGKIELMATTDNPENPTWVTIEIKDTGEGISKEEQAYIFEQFFRTQNQQRSSSTGTGIGLALAKELTELLSGEIWVESTPGRGSSFFVKLPLHKTETLASVPGKESTSTMKDGVTDTTEQTQSTDRILVVEDNPELRIYLAEILSDYQVTQAENGQVALSLAQKEQPDLIISDVMMPLMDGLQLTQRIKEEESTCQIPIILLTARIADQEQIEGLEYGADDYITKPFNANILRIKVKKLIESRKQMKTLFSKRILLEPTEITIETHEEEFLKNAMQIVEEEMANPEFSAVALAEKLHMSQPTLYRRIKTMTGQNIVDFIKSIRIKRAAQLIQTNQFSMTQISEMVGFNDPSYFRRCFSKQFGVNPSQYRINQTNKP